MDFKEMQMQLEVIEQQIRNVEDSLVGSNEPYLKAKVMKIREYLNNSIGYVQNKNKQTWK